MTRGTLKRPASRLASGAFARASSRLERRVDRVRTVGFVPRHDAGGRRNAGGVDVLDLVGVVENVAELTRVELDFLLVEPQVRERMRSLRSAIGKTWRAWQMLAFPEADPLHAPHPPTRRVGHLVSGIGGRPGRRGGRTLAAAAERTSPRDTVTALIAPHAGLVYSGPVAAHAYRQLEGRTADIVVWSARLITSDSTAYPSIAAAASTHRSASPG